MTRNVIYDRFIILKRTLYSRSRSFVNFHVFAVIYSLRSLYYLSVEHILSSLIYVICACILDVSISLSPSHSWILNADYEGLNPKILLVSKWHRNHFKCSPFSRERRKQTKSDIQNLFQFFWELRPMMKLSLEHSHMCLPLCWNCSDLINELNEFVCMASRCCLLFFSSFFSDTYFFHFKSIFSFIIVVIFFLPFCVCLNTVDKIGNYKRFVAFGLFLDGSKVQRNRDIPPYGLCLLVSLFIPLYSKN